MSTTKNIAYNLFSQIGQKGVSILNQLLLIPFFLSSWGPEYYGEWLTLCAIPNALMFTDMGFGTSACNSFVLEWSAGHHKKAADIYKTGMYLISCCIGLGILLSFVVMSITKQSGVLEKSVIPSEESVYALIFMMSSQLCNFYNQLYQGYYRCSHHAAMSVNLYSLRDIIVLSVNILVLTTGLGAVYAISVLRINLLHNLHIFLQAIFSYLQSIKGRN